jgi:hypothetical protein
MFSKVTVIGIRALSRRAIFHLAGYLLVLVNSGGTALAATNDDELFAVATTLLQNPCVESCERESFSVTPLGSRRVAIMSDERFKSSDAAFYLIRSNEANCRGEAPDCEAAIIVSDGRIWRFLASSGEGYDYLRQVRMIETGRFRELTEPEATVVTQNVATGSPLVDKLCEVRGMSPLADQINEFLAAGPARLSDANGEEVAEIKDRSVVWPGSQVNGSITEVGAGTICVKGADSTETCLKVYRCQDGEASFVLADETGIEVALLRPAEQPEQSGTSQGEPVAESLAADVPTGEPYIFDMSTMTLRDLAMLEVLVWDTRSNGPVQLPEPILEKTGNPFEDKRRMDAARAALIGDLKSRFNGVEPSNVVVHVPAVPTRLGEFDFDRGVFAFCVPGHFGTGFKDSDAYSWLQLRMFGRMIRMRGLPVEGDHRCREISTPFSYPGRLSQRIEIPVSDLAVAESLYTRMNVGEVTVAAEAADCRGGSGIIDCDLSLVSVAVDGNEIIRWDHRNGRTLFLDGQ